MRDTRPVLLSVTCTSCRPEDSIRVASGLVGLGPPEVGTSFLGQGFGSGASPFGDFRVMAGEENLRYLSPLPDLGPSIMRMLQQPPRKAFLLGAFGVAQDPWAQPNHRVDQDQVNAYIFF